MSKTLRIIFTVIAVILVALILLVTLSTFNENLNKPTVQEEAEDVPIQEELDFDMDAEGVDAEEFIIETIEEGEGEEAKEGDKVSVHYTGRLLTGEVFDDSYARETPIEFTLGEGRVIEGWEEGIPGMKVGEKRILTIPSSMAYGEAGGGGNIPPNSGLEFEVEMIEINPED